ncbi:tetratricopeptide repeat protein [Allomuricauda sp. R78024]|uniref:tetratricopeptide repeat protein n=1 Tax=Allomuricauda sp. R78024 TaxID=3093867 RepID=UPI0037C7EF8C
MKRLIGTYIFISLFSFWTYAQEEEQSAEVFLEEYTDEFQESFFEALKQKGIQNYDRAIDLFLECKRLDSSNSVIDYELAKAYFLDKQYIQAQEYAVDALKAKPMDFWYLETLLRVLEKQGTSIDVIQQQLPFSNNKLQENLAVFYFKKRKYNDALKVLEGLGNSKFATDLTLKINDSIQRVNEKLTTAVKPEKTVQKEDGPIAQYQSQIEGLLVRGDFKNMEEVSKEALDSYPLQPYFHYAYGTALNRTSKSTKAVEVLESALDYLLDDVSLANKIYAELSKAYTAIGNASKANEYLNKIKTGL